MITINRTTYTPEGEMVWDVVVNVDNLVNGTIPATVDKRVKNGWTQISPVQVAKISRNGWLDVVTFEEQSQ